MGARPIEDAQLVAAAIRHDDTSVRQLCRVAGIVEHVRLLAFEDADRDGWLGADFPGEAGGIGWARVFDDLDAGAVAGLAH